MNDYNYYPPGFKEEQMLNQAYQEVERDYGYIDPYVKEIQLKNKQSNHYYQVGGIEVIDYIRAKLTPEQYKGYLLGNIYKYSGRAQYKGEYEKDVVKLAQYTNWLLQC
jgi:hypothetical protein